MNSMQNIRDKGFTIVELLIVIVVIAILAAISVVAYSGVQNRANDSVVTSDIAALRKKFELAKVDIGYYPQNATDLNNYVSHKLGKSAYDTKQNNIYYITDTAADTYSVGLRSKSNKGFIVTNSGLQENVDISAAATASAIGVVWGSPGTYARQGYTASSGAWSPSWVWTN